MKSLSTPKLVRKLRGRLDELSEITEELARRRVELDLAIDSRYVDSQVYRNTVVLNSATRRETL